MVTITTLKESMEKLDRPGAIFRVDKSSFRDRYFIDGEEVCFDVGAKILANARLRPRGDGMFGVSQTFELGDNK
jgi:hypothetical protein